MLLPKFNSDVPFVQLPPAFDGNVTRENLPEAPETHIAHDITCCSRQGEENVKSVPVLGTVACLVI